MSDAPNSHTLQVLQRRDDNKRFAAIEADLMPAFTALKLDLKRSTYLGRKGDLLCFLIEVKGDGWKRDPALLLANKNDPRNRNTYVVLNELWLLVDPDIPDDRMATMQNRRDQASALNTMAEHLYGFVMRESADRVLDAVFEFAEDLKNAKPPTWMSAAQWQHALAEDDMILRINDVVVNG